MPAVLLALSALAFFIVRVRHGYAFVSFNDELEHLLGGWALNSGDILYRDFVDLHGPLIFMLAQIHGALFGWTDANAARLVIAGAATLAGISVASSPALAGPARWWATSLYFGLLASVWLVQGLYLFSTYPVSGACAVVMLAWFVVPCLTGRRVPPGMAFAAGGAGALLAFASYAEALTALLLGAAGCRAVLRTEHRRAARAHVLGAGCIGLVLLGWLVLWADPVGYLAFHVAFGQAVYPRLAVLSPSFGKFAHSLAPSLRPERLVQTLATVLTLAGVVALALTASGPGRRRAPLVAAVAAGAILLNVRGLDTFQNGAFLMTGVGLAALTIPLLVQATLPRSVLRHGGPTVLCAALIVCMELAARTAIGSPSRLTRAEIVRQLPARIAAHSDAIFYQHIRAVVRPGERMLALVFRPDIYWAAGRLPVAGMYEYLPTDALYATAPWFGRTRDLCSVLALSPPPAIVFDNWVVWDIYRPHDYMPCLFTALSARYVETDRLENQSPSGTWLFVRKDRIGPTSGR